MHVTAKIIRISRAKYHCDRLTTVQDVQNYRSLIFSGTQCGIIKVEVELGNHARLDGGGGLSCCYSVCATNVYS